MSKPPKVVIPGLNRGSGIPPGYILGRRRGTGKGPAELLDLAQMKGAGLATTAQVTQVIDQLSTALSTTTAGLAGAALMLGAEGGEDGASGPPGQPGTAGTSGSPGATGPAGPPGFALDGQDGEEGMPIPGLPGSAGSIGATGPQGPIGLGMDGQDGEDGMPGGPYVNRGGDTMTGPLTITGVAAPLTAANTGICEATISGQSRTRFVVARYSSDALSNSNLVQKARGTISAPSAVVTNDAVGLCESVAYGTSGFKPVAKIQSFVVAATPSDTDMESEISVEVVPSGSVTSTQIALFRYATGLTMYGTNVVIDQNSLVNLRSYATGSLPTAGTPGRLAYDSTAGAPKYDTGAAWALFGGATGPQGATGLLGPMGLDGQDGEDGMPIPGAPGPAGASGGGSFQFISQVVLGVAAASIDFSSIPSTYEKLVIEFVGRGDTAAATVVVNMHFNADSGANYDWFQYQMFHDATIGSGATSGESLAQTSMNVGQIPANTAGANRAACLSIDLPGYARTVFFKKSRARIAASLGLASFTEGVGFFDGEWRSTAAINEVTLLPASGNFVAGSVATLWGIKNS